MDEPVRSGRHAAVVGMTASGKSALGLEVARRRPGTEIVSVDSMQVYRDMDIGTAKPTPAERAEVAHHLIDIADPSEEFTVSRFQEEFHQAITEIEARGGRALLIGGTGLYLRSVVDDLRIPERYPAVRDELDGEPETAVLYRRLVSLDPVAAARTQPGNRRRVVRALEVTIGSGRPFSSFGPGLTTYAPSRFRLLGVRLPRDVVAERIAARYRRQVAGGFVDEVRALAARPAGLSRTAGQALGYREVLEHLSDSITLDEAVERAVGRTRRFAWRQDRWFRRDPRISWLEADDPGNLLSPLLAALEDWCRCG